MQPIVILDSGIGGLSIYKSIKKLLPQEDYIYIADKKYFPYGELSSQLIQERVNKILGYFRAQNTKLVILACNTATVSALSSARKNFPALAIVGTVPVIKTCAERTQNNNIGVLCTLKTARSSYQKKIIAQFASDKNVYVKACPGLVELIESADESSSELSKSLEYLKRKNIDTLALGCTHFPLIRKRIQKIMGDKVLILDSSYAIARQAKRVLENNKTLRQINKKTKGTTIFYTTANPPMFDIMIRRYLGKNFKSKLLKI